MRFIFCCFCLLSFPAAAESILDALKGGGDSLILQKQLKKNVGSLLPSSRAFQDFSQAFEKKDFKKALGLWLDNIRSSDFAKSSTGSALYAYMLFKNDFRALSLKHLLEKTQAKEVNSIVSNLWKLNRDKEHPIWRRFFFPIGPEWHGFLPPEAVFNIGSKSLLGLSENQEYMKFLLSLPLRAQRDMFSAEWPFVLSLIQKGDKLSSTKILAWLTKKTKKQNRREKIYLTIARLLADIGEAPAALHYYDKLKDKSSYYWLLAQEEKTWILLKLGDYQRAYASAAAFEYPGFRSEMSPSMFLALSLSQLKNCNYEGVSRSLSGFQDVFSKKRSKMLQWIKPGSYDDFVNQILSFYKKGGADYRAAAESFGGLDYKFRSDKFLKNYILLQDYIKKEKASRAASFPQLEKTEDQFIDNLQGKIQKRIQFLSKKELKRIASALKSIEIISAEALYRIQGLHPFHPAAYAAFKGHLGYSLVSSSDLRFPFEPNEFWLDEASDFHAGSVKNCPKANYVL